MSEEQKVVKSRGRPSTDYASFPRNTLLQSLKISQAIHDNNAGQAYSRLSIAEAIGISPGSSGYRVLITSSSRYGLTEGGQQSEKISLSPIGLSIVSPRTPEERSAGLRNALLFPELFNKVYSQFNGHKLPPKELLGSTLARDFNVSPGDKLICAEMILKNTLELGIITDIKGNQYLQLDKLGTAPMETAAEIAEDAAGESQQTEEINVKTPIAAAKVPIIVKPTVFISHSKNMKILDQMKQILAFGEFDYQIAVEKETTAIPIPDKIFGLMRNCNCAVINVSADEQEKLTDGTYSVNPNVLIEIGGAFLTYNKRVILLVDKRVKLPSNLQGLYRCDYEGDELSWDTAMRLQKALAGFRDLLKGGGDGEGKIN